MRVLDKGITMRILIHAFYRHQPLILARNIGTKPSFRSCRQVNTAVANWETFKVIIFFSACAAGLPSLNTVNTVSHPHCSFPEGHCQKKMLLLILKTGIIIGLQ